jgi:hypothetical protein
VGSVPTAINSQHDVVVTLYCIEGVMNIQTICAITFRMDPCTCDLDNLCTCIVLTIDTSTISTNTYDVEYDVPYQRQRQQTLASHQDVQDWVKRCRVRRSLVSAVKGVGSFRRRLPAWPPLVQRAHQIRIAGSWQLIDPAHRRLQRCSAECCQL